MFGRILRRCIRLAQFITPSWGREYYCLKTWQSGCFDKAFYIAQNPSLHPIFKAFPIRHFVVFGEQMGLQPNQNFLPKMYLQLNPDLFETASPFLHFILHGAAENRVTNLSMDQIASENITTPDLRNLRPTKTQSKFLIVVHIYYHDMWDDIAARLRQLDFKFDLIITITRQGEISDTLKSRINSEFPGSAIIFMPNHGRDIFPFVHLANAGLLSGYSAICKIHTKKSPHRSDGFEWFNNLVDGILPRAGTQAMLNQFCVDETNALWVADGQLYHDPESWGVNKAGTQDLLHRLEISVNQHSLSFPAGSMYWLKPVLIDMIRGLQLSESDFEPEQNQLDGTAAHAFERAIGYMAQDGGHRICRSAQLKHVLPVAEKTRPRFISAFFLPQFHRIPENDKWWGKGYTEWIAAAAATPAFAGHAQPTSPSELGYYDLTTPGVLAEHTALAKQAGIDAFCVYHYWFNGRRLLENPIDLLTDSPQTDFPFYLCWANESWRRNWDGLSGECLVKQSYANGFERRLAQNTARYFADHRYQKPDGTRPRFVIYRPDDLPRPAENIAKLRSEWAKLGFDQVELGAVRFHQSGQGNCPEDLVDFWIEMPPHGLVRDQDYLFGGPEGNKIDIDPVQGFRGLIYDYRKLVERSLSPDYRATLAQNTIAGVMPSWDNTARRGLSAHIAWGANPMTFRGWLKGLSAGGLETSYQQELFVNAWNEWAEKAMLEPSRQYGRAYLMALADLKQHAHDV